MGGFDSGGIGPMIGLDIFTYKKGVTIHPYNLIVKNLPQEQT